MSTTYGKITVLTVTLLAGFNGDLAGAQDLRPGSSCLYGRVHGLVAGEARRPTDIKRDFRPINGAVLNFHNVGTGEEFELESAMVQSADATDAAIPYAQPPPTDPAQKPPVLECRKMPSNYWTNLPVGIYQVTIRHPDYQTYDHPRRIVVRARDRSLRVDFLRLTLRHCDVSLVADESGSD